METSKDDNVEINGEDGIWEGCAARDLTSLLSHHHLDLMYAL
jgi:hypothetical protein